MELRNLVSEILLDVALKKPSKPYRNVYFIKALNPGDRKGFFASFRYKSSRNEVFICFVEINLDNTDKNVSFGISFLKPRERESITFFKQRLAITHKNIVEILQQTVVPTLVSKLQKVEDMYESN